MLTREFTHAGRTTRFTVTSAPGGWDVREEQNDTIVRKTSYTDWHRVERAILVFEQSVQVPTFTDPR